ncbi:FG-GAP-like repeat-containing protein, partial [bacterium]|nr:FG-GAP-like repeat-containing protein [bacterium]
TYPFYGDGRLFCDAGALDVAVVDLDGDSDLDLVIAETGSNTVSYSLNTGTTMAVRVDASTTSDGASSVAAGQVDTSGNPAVLAGGTTTIEDYRQLLVSPGAFVADDFDNDGVEDDFVIGDRYLLLYIEAFGSPAQFGLAGLTNLDVGIVSVDSGDFDGTGGPDLALSSANYSGGSLLTVMNTGVGTPTWGTAVRVDSGFGAVGSVVVANMDGLNRDDAVVCIPGENRVGIYPSTGAGALETYPFYGDGSLYCDAGALDVAVVDLDGDSDLDVVIAETGSNTVSYSLNTGTTMAVRVDASTTSDGASSVAAGDTDGDGDADVLAGGTTTVQLYQNELNLGFSVACAQPGGAINASGSDLVSSNTMTLHLTGAESGQMGYFINSYLGGNSPGTPINPGGTVGGQVCISGTDVIYGRHVRTGELFTTDGTGAASLPLDLTDLSNPRDGNQWPNAYSTSVLAGETWYWQAWYRVTGGSEFSDAIGVTFR